MKIKDIKKLTGADSVSKKGDVLTLRRFLYGTDSCSRFAEHIKDNLMDCEIIDHDVLVRGSTGIRLQVRVRMTR